MVSLPDTDIQANLTHSGLTSYNYGTAVHHWIVDWIGLHPKHKLSRYARDIHSQLTCVRGPPSSAGLVQIRCVRRSHSSSASLKGVGFTVFSTEVNLLFCFAIMLLTLPSPLARAPYVVFFDLKPLIEDGNLQVYMYCVHARKRASKHVKSLNFLWACPQTPLTQSILWGPIFCICPAPPQSSRRPCGAISPRGYSAIVLGLQD